MGLCIYATDETAPLPRHLVLELECEGEHGLLKATSIHLEGDNYMGLRQASQAQGWRWNVRGKVFGPCCKGAQ